MRMQSLRGGAVALVVGLCVGVATAWAYDEDKAAASADSAGQMVVGTLALIEGDSYTVQEEGGNKVRFKVTSQTSAPRGLKVGAQIIVALLPDGVAAMITDMGHTEEAPPLRVDTPPAETLETR